MTLMFWRLLPFTLWIQSWIHLFFHLIGFVARYSCSLSHGYIVSSHAHCRCLPRTTFCGSSWLTFLVSLFLCRGAAPGTVRWCSRAEVRSRRCSTVDARCTRRRPTTRTSSPPWVTPLCWQAPQRWGCVHPRTSHPALNRTKPYTWFKSPNYVRYTLHPGDF
jgi:hypothetical protein